MQATAFISNGIASPTASAQFTTGGSNLPTTPGSLAATVVSGHEIDLAWTLSGQVNYSQIYVYRSSDGGTTYHLIATLEPSTTSYIDWGVQNGVGYLYKVGTLNSSGESDTPTPASATATGSFTLDINVTAPSATPYP